MGNDTTIPRLVAVSGRLQGTVIPLEEEETSIGRDPENLVCINEHWISREHCVIRNQNGQFKVIDLGSHNGTFVNGVPIKEQLLEHEDRIGFAGAMFLFLLHEVDATPSAEVELAEEASPFGPTVRLRRDDAVYLNPSKLHSAKIPPARVERDLSALLKVSNALASEQDVNALQRTILEQIFAIVPAQRGAILLGPGENSKEFVTSFGLDHSGKQSVQVSRTIVAQAINEKAAILCLGA